MNKLVLATVLLPLALPSYAAPPRWTILQQACWKISETAGQCAVRLLGPYPNQAACKAANGGQLMVEAPMPDGRKLARRCEIYLEGD